MNFPDPRLAREDGLLFVGGDLSTSTLLAAYRQGIFPWPHEGYPLLWFSPPQRGVLFFDRFKIPDSTKRVLKKEKFRVTFNSHFSGVIEQCSRVHRRNGGTWITKDMQLAYQKLHSMGYALSVEVWLDNKMVGGLYGVWIDGVFSGESMFHQLSEASKVAVTAMVEWLQGKGGTWMDIQMVTPVLQRMGGTLVARDQYLQLLAERQKSYLESQKNR